MLRRGGGGGVCGGDVRSSRCGPPCGSGPMTRFVWPWLLRAEGGHQLRLCRFVRGPSDTAGRACGRLGGHAGRRSRCDSRARRRMRYGLVGQNAALLNCRHGTVRRSRSLRSRLRRQVFHARFVRRLLPTRLTVDAASLVGAGRRGPPRCEGFSLLVTQDAALLQRIDRASRRSRTLDTRLRCQIIQAWLVGIFLTQVPVCA